MSEWKEKTLGELSIRVSSGLTPLKSNTEFWENPSIPWLKTDQLGEKYIFDTNTKISKEALEQTNLRIYPENTISIAMYGEGKTRGNLSIIKVPMTTNQACCNIEIDPKLADVEYVYYYLKTQYDSLRKLSSGVRKNLNSNDIKNYKIYIPESVSVQKSIVRFLTSLDNKISINNQINQELEAMAKTLYDYWFVQFDFPDQNGKPYKSSGGKMVYNPELKREIPEGWGVTTFSSWISDNKTGDWGKETSQGNYTLEVDCIRGADINGLSGNGKTDMPTRFILEKNKNKLLTDFDIVIEISGGSPTQSTGRIVGISENVLNRFDLLLICSNFCKAVSLKEQETFYNFVYEWKNLYDNGVLFSWEGKTSGIKNLLFDSFVTNYHIAQPPIDLMEQFFDYASSVDRKIQLLLKQNQELTQLRDWLLPMLINGQVKVE